MKKIHRMYMLSFLFSLHISLSAYVNSSYLSDVVGEKYVGLLYTIASILTLILLSNTSKILKYLGNRKLTFLFLMINMATLYSFVSTKNPLYVSIAFVLFLTTNVLVYYCFDIFMEHFSEEKSIGRSRGMYLTIINMAWIVSPLITGFLIARDGNYNSVYTIAFATVIITIIAMFLSIRSFDDKQYTKTPFLKAYRFLHENRHIRAVTLINFILQFFFSIMVIYTPIYLAQHIGFTWDKMGIIFTFMLAPFVLLGIPVGRLIDIYHVKKRLLLTIGLILMSIFTSIMTFVNIDQIWIWALILFMTRVGASIVETTSEIYFFTHVKEEDAYLLSVFRDMVPIAYLIGPALGTIFLSFFDYRFMFLALGIFVLSGLYYVTKLKHNHGITIPNQNQ